MSEREDAEHAENSDEMGRLPRVVIVGGGFAGLAAAKALGDAPVRITLIDRVNYHLFQPLLYEVATAVLNPADIATPTRHVLRHQRRTEVLLGEVVGIDADRRRVLLADGDIDYDYLILATGVTHSYFGHDEWSRTAPGLKTVEDALEIRRRVLLAYEAAERETDGNRRAAWLTFVIVGGGATGTELAGAFAEIAHHALPGDFRHADPRSAHVLLIEGMPRVMPTYSERLSEKARTQLERLGVHVLTGERVVHVDETGVSLAPQDGAAEDASRRIEARTVIWAAGVTASPLGRYLGVPLDRAGRVRVEPGLSVPGHRELFVVGDLASLQIDGKPIPGVAQAAIQGGRHAARCIRDDLAGRARGPFRYDDRGMLATIGRSKAIGVVKGVEMSGFVAWLAWLCIHLVFLIGFRNRLMVLSGWAWKYFTQQRGVRLITATPHPRLLAAQSTLAPEHETPPTPPEPPPATLH